MTIAPLTTRPGDWEADISALPTSAPSAPAAPADLSQYMIQDVQRPDPSARTRMAELLHEMTGWDIFPEIPGDREYVSRLWAQDWDSPEDSVYDE